MYIFTVMGIEFRDACLQGKPSAAELKFQPSCHKPRQETGN